jgi:hypothetical protein
MNPLQQADVAATLSGAAASVSRSTTMVFDYIRRGPQGVTWLCFVGGVANIVFNLGTLVDIFDVLSDPVTYVVCVYQMMFGLCSCMIEAPKEWANEKVGKVQKFIYDRAKFLTTAGGRGLFYLFQASLVLAMDNGLLSMVLGLYMLGIALLCIAWQYKLIEEKDYLHVTGPGS